MVSQIAVLDIKHCLTVGAQHKEGEDMMAETLVFLKKKIYRKKCIPSLHFEQVAGRKDPWLGFQSVLI